MSSCNVFSCRTIASCLVRPGLFQCLGGPGGVRRPTALASCRPAWCRAGFQSQAAFRKSLHLDLGLARPSLAGVRRMGATPRHQEARLAAEHTDAFVSSHQSLRSTDGTCGRTIPRRFDERALARHRYVERDGESFPGLKRNRAVPHPGREQHELAWLRLDLLPRRQRAAETIVGLSDGQPASVSRTFGRNGNVERGADPTLRVSVVRMAATFAETYRPAAREPYSSIASMAEKRMTRFDWR